MNHRDGAIALAVLLVGNAFGLQAPEENRDRNLRPDTSAKPLLRAPALVRENVKRSKDELWAGGNQALKAGRMAEAVQRFREIVTIDPVNPKARIDLAFALVQAGDRKGAVTELSDALQMAPDNAAVHYNLGVVLAELGSEQQAVEHLQAAVRSDPQMTKAHFQLANLLMRQGRYAEAPPEYAAVVLMEPRNGFARLMEAIALVRLNNYAAARDRLEQGLAALPGDADLKLALARLLAASPEESVRNGRRALELLQQVMGDEKSFDLDLGQTLAMALAAAGQFQEAVKIQRYMIAELQRAGQSHLAQLLHVNLTSYESNQACLIPWRDDDPIFSPVPGNLAGPTEKQSPNTAATNGPQPKL